MLQSHLTLRDAETIVSGAPRSPWMFPRDDGGPITSGSFWQNTGKPRLKRAGIRHRKPHAVRHTFASLLSGHGESPAYVKEQTAHSSIKITVTPTGT